MKPRILLVTNADWYFWSHRLPLARALQTLGCGVTVAAAAERGYGAAIEGAGFQFHPLRLRRRSTAVHRELQTVLELYRLYRQERPDLVHHITIKPILYGSVAAGWAGVPAVVNTIPGLGYTFSGSGPGRLLLQGVVSLAYRVALSGRRTRVIFQNPDDHQQFVSRGVVPSDRCVVIRGSGVDIFTFSPLPEPPGPPVVLLASRLLWDKGVEEFVSAARELRGRGCTCRMVLVGSPDRENPRSVTPADIAAWQGEGTIEWWGHRDDMPGVLGQSTIVVLPSYYREGVPKILLEAAACGRPVITTDVPGCREAVVDGKSGLLVPPRDPLALADAIVLLLRDAKLRAAMGARGRAMVEAEFSEERVVSETLGVYRELLGDHFPGETP
jgi:glycosyltransferase involved in cell wall biosynthesis